MRLLVQRMVGRVGAARARISGWARASPVRRAAEEEQSGSNAIPDKLTLNFFVPHEVIAKEKKVYQVTLPGVDGVFGVLAGHVPTAAELGPGVVEVFDEDKSEPAKYFVSGGFAFIHENSTADVSVVEAVPLDSIDPDAVQTTIAEGKKELEAATNEAEQAIAQIKIDVGEAMANAIGSQS